MVRTHPKFGERLKGDVMDKNEKRVLEITACKARMGVIDAVHAAKSGHPGGSLSICDALTYLYFKKMNICLQALEKGVYSTRGCLKMLKGVVL